jgi:hypothetical protein
MALGTVHLSVGDSMKENLGKASCTGVPKRYVKQDLEMGVCFWETGSSTTFLGPSYMEEFL